MTGIAYDDDLSSVIANTKGALPVQGGFKFHHGYYVAL